MNRLLLALSVVFAFGAMCTGGAEDEQAVEDPVVVPVDGDGSADEDEGYWCCEYKDEADNTQYALVEGPAECNAKYGAKDGRYVDGNQCIPCCCETDKDADDASKGQVYELTTPKSCSTIGGECKEASHEACADGDSKPKKERTTTSPRPTPRAPRTISNPGERSDRRR